MSNQGPWGSKDPKPQQKSEPKNSGWNGSSNGDGPELDEMLNKLKQEWQNLIGGKDGQSVFKSLFLLVIVLYLLSGFYRVLPEEQAVILQFGKWNRTSDSGLHYHLPFPIERAIKIQVTRENRTEVGTPQEHALDEDSDSLMLTGDENIVDVQFVVFWRIKDAGNYLFHLQNPEDTLKMAAESALREIIGQTPIDKALTEQRGEIQVESEKLLQEILDRYQSGIEVTQVRVLTLDAPPPVIDAFRDVQRAKSEKETLKNQAEAYRNDILPKAKGEAERIAQDAEAYKQEVINRAQGDANRFNSILTSYKLAPGVTSKRIYFETMEEVLKNSKKIIVDKGASAVVPYIPMPNAPAPTVNVPPAPPAPPVKN